MSEDVRLTLAELQIAHFVSTQRHIHALKGGGNGNHGAPEDVSQGTGISILGCIGELAVSKYMNMYWSGSVPPYTMTDVGGCVEVKTIEDTGKKLLIRPNNSDELPFVLALCSDGGKLVRLLGWSYAGDAKVDAYRTAPNGRAPCWMVPQSALNPMSDLVRARA